ncbi:MAG TPA: hypothetical protein VGR69_02965, partial [Candidatus Rubrimentiphilum sp.]|nr:hypothetical protein [Candidatus Rubrimentiphilum sp.]
VPIGVLTLRSMNKRDIDSATGLSSLIRQFGGMVGIALIATTIERYHDAFLRVLMLDVPRWPYRLGVAEKVPPAIVASLVRQANALAYQRLYALSAIVMFLIALAVLIAVAGVWYRGVSVPEATTLP